ncbi:hypothetical protein PGB90_009901 [Kerria lacca]
MGLLTEGSPLSWEQTKEHADHVREHGIIQFINLFHRLKDKTGDILKFGDEVEYVILKVDHKNKIARLSLRGGEILKKLNAKEQENPENVNSLWRPEYAAYMIEGTPGKPYGGLTAHFNIVEANMKCRREEVERFLEKDEILMCLTAFPRLGCPDFTWPICKPNPKDGASHSLFFPQNAIFQDHPRFVTLTRNIRKRRGEKVAINLPIFKDKNTLSPFTEDFSILGDDGESAKAALPDHVYLDAMGFGMGCCCLQLTFQSCCIEEARRLYDQLTPLCPIMLAITAASPIFRGYLTDIDCRWSVISGSVDCRTKEERGIEPLKKNKFVIPKSRYDSVDSYLSNDSSKFNDIPLIYEEEIYQKLKQNNIDHLLSQHIAHLFIRDTVSLFSEKVNQNDEIDTDHFENIQSTNWQTMRFKPPPPNSNIGWRVEFRPCELQFSDFENAAVVCFIVMLTRVILSYQLDLVIPISKVDENLKNAQKRNAINTEKFWFRKYINLSSTMCSNLLKDPAFKNINFTPDDSEPVYIQMTINEIINGKEGEFPGLIPLLNSYLFSMEIDADTHCTIQQYLNLIKGKASGEIMTTASWMRNFVRNHSSYKFDSLVNDEINYDLLMKAYNIQTGQDSCPELLGQTLGKFSKTTDNIPSSLKKAYCPKQSC